MDDQNQPMGQDNTTDQAPQPDENQETNQSAPEVEAPAAPANEDKGQSDSLDTNAPEEQVMQIGKYSVKIIKSLCIGAASCIAVSPAVYKLNEENIAVFLEGGTDTEENVLASAQSCPTKAIIIQDTEVNQQVWPV